MSKRTSNLLTTLVWPSIAVGIIVFGCAMVDSEFLVWPLLIGVGVLCVIAAAVYLYQTIPASAGRNSPSSTEVTPVSAYGNGHGMLLPDHELSEARTIQHPGKLRDTEDVASLVAALDHSNESNEPGWDEVCESIVGTIARTGDASCLPALGRVRLARGSKFRDAVDSAIAAIICNQSTGVIESQFKT